MKKLFYLFATVLISSYTTFAQVRVQENPTPTRSNPTTEKVRTQHYKNVRVTFKTGQQAKGKTALLSDGTLSLNQNGQAQTYQLSEISIIEAKKNKTGIWALSCGGGCATLCFVSGMSLGREGFEELDVEVGEYIISSLFWTGIFAGTGALIGALSSHYKNVFVNNQSAISPLKMNFKLGSKDLSKYNLQLTYNF